MTESGPLLASATTSTPRLSKPKRKSPTKLSHLSAEEQSKHHAARKAEYQLKHKDRLRVVNLNTRLVRDYGVTLEQRDALFESQGFACAICKSDTSSKKGWHVDHCHKTNVVRGVLCHYCNVMLGMAKDNPSTLIKAASYLGS